MFKLMYSERHNRIVDLVFEKVSFHNKTSNNIKDKMLTPTLFGSELQAFDHLHKRPDITMIDEDTKQMALIEVAVPYDVFIKQCFQNKFDKYFPLSLEINGLGYRTEIVVLLIGSMGSVHYQFVSGLTKLNINKREATF